MNFFTNAIRTMVMGSAIAVLAASAEAQSINIINPPVGTDVFPGDSVPVFIQVTGMSFPIQLQVTLEGDAVLTQTTFSGSTATINDTWAIPVGATPGSTLSINVRLDQAGSSPVTASRTVNVLNPTPPANDNLANAIVLPGDFGTRDDGDTNDTATSESNENSHDGLTPSNSVWYSWTAPADGDLSLNTVGSDFDTVLAVYTGTTFPLTPVASNDDIDFGNNILESRVDFSVTGGETYQIAVDSAAFDTGEIQVNWNFAILSSSDNWNLYQ